MNFRVFLIFSSERFFFPHPADGGAGIFTIPGPGIRIGRDALFSGIPCPEAVVKGKRGRKGIRLSKGKSLALF